MTAIRNALSGALAAQAAINATSQNTANMKTRGYTRQGVLLTALGPSQGMNGPGLGVQVSALLRFSDAYKSQQLWRANSELGMRTQSQPYLSQLERIMGDDKTSISNGIDQFFQALNAAGVDPISTPLRGQVVTAAGAMAQAFNSIYSVTRNQQLSVQQQRESMLPQANTLIANIADLNDRITQAGALGTNTSALVDERDLAIDDLSKMMAIEVLQQPDGSSSVSLKSGQPLVTGKLAAQLQLVTTPPATTAELRLSFAGSVFGLDATRIGGSMGGLADFEQNTLAPLQTSIMELAKGLSDKINAQQALGQNGRTPPTAGTDLFVYNASGTGGLLNLASNFKSEDLAFSANGQPGDSGNLQKLIAIKNASISLTSIGNVQIGDADTQLVGKLGIDSKQNQSLLKNATTIREQAEEDWASTSSVNEDEEAINLVEFQKMYQANMKAIAVANSLFDSTLAMFN
ncbi:flagellar hook-associated protein FlgK [Pseudoduganella violacea]|uniref:Flagellar hook-associated protein 1 n=1 Tax=Pseudoduganella violacea TaxID=1715466 RepID=A0A7W5BCW6_9BURK|nr:flagellar hook-associated protein FlgK [Pseudoduganella violacea]MBB3120808.1 flagellar hook-associated protein 1 FlgK [Pseudoduganella violacea]